MSGSWRTEAWERFLKRAAYVRAHPRFDAAERGRRLELAKRLQALLEAGVASADLRPSLDALISCLYDPAWPHPLAPREHRRWIEAWASGGEDSLRRALVAFAEEKGDWEARFARFAEAAEAAELAGSIERRPRVVLTLGSLLNFAVEPLSLPVVWVHPYARLEQTLGHAAMPEAPILEQYRNHVAFAKTLEAEVSKAGIPVRDMLDAQALVFISALEEFWELDPPGDRGGPASAERPAADRGGRDAKAYLSVCSCLGYDAPYLLEWIEFHRLVGVERFFLYNNGDRETQRELLAPYVEAGIVVLHDWPVFPPQLPAHRHCLETYREDSRWIAFIDTDEFLFSPLGERLPEALTAYEAWPGIGINQAFFGTSGHRKKPDGLVTESYVQRIVNTYIKSIVDPMAVADCPSPHYFHYLRGSAVDENLYPITGSRTIYVSFSELRVNHYNTKSEEEFRAKLARPLPDYGAAREASHFDFVELVDSFGGPDDAILQYVPALKDELLRAEARGMR